MQKLAESLPTIVTQDKAPIGSIVINKVNPIVTIDTIVASNDAKTVDYLLTACSDIIDARYKPFFAKRFYRLVPDSVLAAASLSRQDGKNPQRFFSNLIKNAPVLA